MPGVFILTAFLAAGLPAAEKAVDQPSLLARLWSVAGAVVGDEESRYYLQVGGITTGAGLSLGPGVRMHSLAGRRFDLDAVTIVSHRKYLLAQGTLSTTLGGGLRAGVFARRKYFPREEFSGIGIESRRSDRVSYTYDETAAGLMATQRSHALWRFDGSLEYRRPDVGIGHDASYPSIETRFSETSAPGLVRQPDYLVGSGSVTYEGAKPIGRPRKGGRYQASVSRYWGQGASGYDFVRFDADLRQYVPIVTDRHVIVFRAAAVLTGTPRQAQVPFYYMARLGGTSSLRGFRHFRFYDRQLLLLQAEYRWLPVRFAEVTVFYDVGSVGPRVSRLGDTMLSDYGAGVRVGTESRVFCRFETALGSADGVKVYVKFSTEF